MKLNKQLLRRMIINELSKLKSPNNQTKLELAIKELTSASKNLGMIFEDTSDEMIQDLETIVDNVIKICEAKKDGNPLSADPKRAIISSINNIKQDVD